MDPRGHAEVHDQHARPPQGSDHRTQPPLRDDPEQFCSGTDGLLQALQQPQAPDDRQADDRRAQETAAVRGIDDGQRGPIARGHVFGPTERLQKPGRHGRVDGPPAGFGLVLQSLIDQRAQFERHIVALPARQAQGDIGDIGFDHVVRIHSSVLGQESIHGVVHALP